MVVAVVERWPLERGFKKVNPWAVRWDKKSGRCGGVAVCGARLCFKKN